MTDPGAERRQQAERQLSRTNGQYAVCDGVHLVDDLVFVRITVSADKPVDHRRLRSDLGDQLAEVVRANWPQGEVDQEHARGGNGRDVSGAGGASSSGNDGAYAAVTPGNSGSGGAGWATARLTVTGGSDGFPDGVRAVVTPGQGGSRVSFLPGGAGEAAGGCCGGSCGCAGGGQA